MNETPDAILFAQLGLWSVMLSPFLCGLAAIYEIMNFGNGSGRESRSTQSRCAAVHYKLTD